MVVEKKSIWVISLLVILAALILALIIVYYSVKINTSPSQEDLVYCNTILDNGEDKINLVFFADEATTKTYSEFLLNTPPFDNYKNNFNIYQIPPESYNPECELYKGIAILCYSKNLIKKASSCPSDYIFVIKPFAENLRSSSYLNVMSINSAHPLTVITHEFGHSFSNLAEEYTPASLAKGSQNCVSSCGEFNDLSDGCFEGCSKSNYFRSIDYGVMRTLSSNDYGKFNSQLILSQINKNIEGSKITGKAIQDSGSCEDQTYYLVELFYNSTDNIITEISKTIESGCSSQYYAQQGPFSYQLVLNNNASLNEEYFNPEFIYTESQGESEINGEVFTSDISFFIKLPIIQDSKSLLINKDQEKISEISLKEIGAIACII